LPEEIRPAFQTLAKAYAQYAVALKGINFKAGQVPDASTIAKLSKAAQGLNNAGLTKANADITAWVTKNCSATAERSRLALGSSSASIGVSELGGA